MLIVRVSFLFILNYPDLNPRCGTAIGQVKVLSTLGSLLASNTKNAFTW